MEIKLATFRCHFDSLRFIESNVNVLRAKDIPTGSLELSDLPWLHTLTRRLKKRKFIPSKKINYL